MRIKKFISMLVSAVVLLSSVNAGAMFNKEDNYVMSEQRSWELTRSKDTVYLADGNAGVLVIDGKDPANPKKITKIETGFDTRVVEYYKNYLFVCGGGQLRTYNVANTEEIFLQMKTSIQNGAARSNIDKNLLGIFGGSSATVFDIKDTKNPVNVGTVSGWGNSLCGYIKDNYLYIVNTKNLLYIYDITDLSNIKQTASAAVDSNYVCDIYVEGDILYAADDKAVLIIDVADKENPKLISKTAADYRPQALYKLGSKLLVGGYSNRVARYDITDVKNPVMEESGTTGSMVYGIEADNNYAYCATAGGYRVMNLNYEFDLTKMPDVPNESVVKDGNKTDIIYDCPYSDVQSHWAKDYISKISGSGYVKGIGNNLFAPDDKMTRAELLAVASRMATPRIERYKQRFADVGAEEWYSDYIETAFVLGLIPEELYADSKIKPQQNITREEAAAVMVRLLRYKGKKIDGSEVLNFADSDKISEWAKPYVCEAYEYGIIEGTEDNTFNPQSDTTRAEISKMLSVVYDKLQVEKADFIAKEYNVKENVSPDFTKAYEPIKYPEDGRPIIIKTTDAVKPGELLSFYGEYMNNAEIYLAEGSCMENEPTEDAKKLEIVSKDKEGQNVTCVIPDEMNSGTFTAWVKNSVGISSPVAINNSRIIYLDQEEIGKGGILRIIGRNLTGGLFDGEMKTGAALVGGGKSYNLEIVDINPYQVKVAIPHEVENGQYEMYVTNDGIRWNKCDEHYGRIMVKGEVYDPYSLNQPWADRFEWDYKIDITKAPYNADNTGTDDVTEAVQKAIDDAHAAGGGIVYFPKGTYRHCGLQMDSKVILMGDGMENSKLVYAYKGDDIKSKQMIGTKNEGQTDGRIGFLNMGFFLDNDKNQGVPDSFFWLGESWGANIVDSDLRTAQYFFIKGCKLYAPLIRPEGNLRGRGLGIVTIAKGHVLYEDNVTYGSQMSFMSNYIKKYTHCINNNSTTSVGNISIVGSHTVIENNVMSRHWWYEADYINAQGIFMRGYSYVVGNTIRSTGKPGGNEGEIVCTEVYRAGTRLAGHVVSAEGTKLKVEPYKSPEGKVLGSEGSGWTLAMAFGDTIEVTITAGKGLGQRRRVIAIDEENETFTLEREWDILPDETSNFMYSTVAYAPTIYNNYANTCAKGLWLYGDTYDSVVAENNLNNSEGIFGYTCYIVNDTTARINLCYFNRIEDNKTAGYSSKGNTCGIGVQAGIESKDPEHVVVYGIDIKNNNMTGSSSYTGPRESESEAPTINGLYATVLARQEQTSGFTVLKGVTFDGNHVSKMDRGVSIGNSEEKFLKDIGQKVKSPMTQNVITRNNTFSEVEHEISDPLDEIIKVD